LSTWTSRVKDGAMIRARMTALRLMSVPGVVNLNQRASGRSGRPP
jgi:hypothetical protein